MRYNRTDNLIKVELTDKTKLLTIIEEIYKTDEVFSVELQFTDYFEEDKDNRYCRCYLVFNSNEDASKFMFKLLGIEHNNIC